MATETPYGEILSGRGVSAPAEQTGTSQSGKKLRILIADDEVDLRAFMNEFCAINGYEAKCVGDGLAALSCLEEGPFDIVIADYLMPGLNGVELVKQTKEKQPDLPVIAMSAWYDMEQAFREAGAYKFMKKPFDPYQLEKELTSIAQKEESS
jgi:DNA-binding NtrC family response regulator